MSLLTFEPHGFKENGEDREAIKDELAKQGIDWHWLKYHKRYSVLATAWDIMQGSQFVRRFISEHRPDILHGRVHVPTFMAALARKLSRQKPKLLFDIRGFMPEEYTDAGVWPENGFVYRTAKRVERWLLKESDGFVVLTERARGILFPESKQTGFDKQGRPVEVIPCCVDIGRFSSANGASRFNTRRDLKVENRFVISYVGSFGGWYLTDEMLNLFETAKSLRSDAYVLILTQRDKDKIAAELRARGFTDDDFLVRSVQPNEVFRYLSASDIAVSFIKACYSKLSSSPTKMAEYLACGLPVIVNAGVGDVDTLIKKNEVGVIVKAFERASYIKAFAEISAGPEIAERARSTAIREFDLKLVGAQRYSRLYENLTLGLY